jgi:hypothetical protein
VTKFCVTNILNTIIIIDVNVIMFDNDIDSSFSRGDFSNVKKVCW